MRVRKLTFATLAVVATLSLTACQGGDDEGKAKDDSSSTATESSSDGGSGTAGGSDGGSDGGSGTAGGSGSGGSDEAGGENTDSSSGSQEGGVTTGKCRTDALEFKVVDTYVDGDSIGSVAVELKNSGGDVCTVSGFAGVDLKTNAGSMSAKRKGQASDPVTLKDGEQVAFNINYPRNETGGSGVKVEKLVVTPPGETKSVTLNWPGTSLPVTDGSGPGVTVGPIGSAGQGGDQG